MSSVLKKRRTPDVALTVLPKRRMTEAQFVAWCDEDTRAEWVDGEVVLMSPENIQHNKLLLFIAYLMGGYIEYHGLGDLYAEGIQVRLAELKRRRLPDLLFVSKHRLGALRTAHLEGPPDLAVELVSPTSVARDYREKFEEYQKAGVREYWIVDPQSEAVEVHRHGRHGKYERISEKEGKIHSTVLRGFYLKPEWLWQAPLPSWLKILKELGVR